MAAHGSGWTNVGWAPKLSRGFVTEIKFLKGCYYAAKGAPLRSDAVCDIRAFSEDPSDALEGAMQRLNVNLCGQPPFQFAYARAAEDDAVDLWWFVLWGHIVIFASSSSPQYVAPDEAGAS
jgi:hypothetical protein